MRSFHIIKRFGSLTQINLCYRSVTKKTTALIRQTRTVVFCNPVIVVLIVAYGTLDAVTFKIEMTTWTGNCQMDKVNELQ